MAYVKHWGIRVLKDIPTGIIITYRLDDKFIVTKKVENREEKTLKIFSPGEILDEDGKTIEKKFKKLLSKITKEKFTITPLVADELMAIEKRMNKIKNLKK